MEGRRGERRWSDPHFVAVAAAFITFAAWQVVDHFLLMEAAVLPMMTYHLVSWIGETAAAAAIALIVLRALVRKNTQLTELNRLKDLLTDALVHDLRQPLTALLSGLLATERDPDIPEKSKYLIALSRQGGEELLGMVNDLLDVSRLEAGEPVISAETISPGEFVGAGAEAMRQFAQESGIGLAFRVPGTLPPVQGDRGRLSRVVMNLVGNALKVTPSGGRVEVSAGVDSASDRVLVRVRDTGPGVPIEARERIFDKFAVLDRGGLGDRTSTGLGLTFCKMIVEAHGGEIWVESEGDEGATLTFALPVHRA